MNPFETPTPTLPPDWKWTWLFDPPEGVEPAWRAWLAEAQRAEERALLAWWAQRRGGSGGDGLLEAA